MGLRRGRGQSKAREKKKINRFFLKKYFIIIYTVWDLLIYLVFLLGV